MIASKDEPAEVFSIIFRNKKMKKQMKDQKTQGGTPESPKFRLNWPNQDSGEVEFPDSMLNLTILDQATSTPITHITPT